MKKITKLSVFFDAVNGYNDVEELSAEITINNQSIKLNIADFDKKNILINYNNQTNSMFALSAKKELEFEDYFDIKDVSFDEKTIKFSLKTKEKKIIEPKIKHLWFSIADIGIARLNQRCTSFR